MGMAHTRIATSCAPAAIGPYSQAISTAGGMSFLSGQIALHPTSGEMVGDGDVERETEQVLKNLQAVLEAAGHEMSDVVACTIFLADLSDFGKVNALYAGLFGEVLPSRATVEVAGLPKGARVEISCIAVRS